MKRRRTNTGYKVNRVKRPKNKKLVICLQTPTTTQDTTVLSGSTETFPYTFKMRKLSISAIGEGTQSTLVRWAIIRVPNGYSLNTLGSTDAASLYDPEVDVLDFGTMALADSDAGTGSTTYTQNLVSRISRKMEVGDAIYFVTDTNNANVINIIAIAEFYQWV